MAQSDAVWGIDIGQCSLKALRCRRHEKSDRIVADAFDFIEYPQVLSAPGADAAQLVRDALQQFLSRNSVKEDEVAISVSGQAGLAKFIKLPPVEVSKIPDIVRFEARQQIPFDLNKEVVWDYQRLEGGAEEEGFVLEAQVGLFAMKRDQAFKALEPFEKSAIEVEYVQLSPLALYNFIRFDQLTELPASAEYDAENPPDSVAILSVGTDATDLVVTDGFRIWQRSIPLGGTHFTKALMKELKLTFAKAEHLKRNATSAQDPKVVFQAMRPVFNEFLTEVQRSLGFFATLERNATVKRIVALGSAVKLPGLRKFLEQNLGLPVERIEGFRGLVGSAVATAPAFQENLGAFGVCYGLALQGLGLASLRTNLIPREVILDRVIRAKKPWAVATAALLLLGLSISYASYSRALGTVDAKLFDNAERVTKSVTTTANSYKQQAEEATKEFETTDKIGQNLVSNIEGRRLWLEVLRAINQCLPGDSTQDAENKREKWPPIDQRKEIHLTSVDCVWTEDLSLWFNGVSQWYVSRDGTPPPAAASGDPNAAGAPPAGAPPADPGAAGGQDPPPSGAAGPKGPGWVIQLKGKHYHNSEQAGQDFGAQYVRKEFVAKIEDPKNLVKIPTLSGKDEYLSLRDLGVSYPVLRDPGRIVQVTLNNPNPDADAADKTVTAREFTFVVQMAWQPMPPSARLEQKKKQLENQTPPANQ